MAAVVPRRSRDVAVGFGNHYTHIHPCFFKAAFPDPLTHHYLSEF
jgi:hypothetical protein